MTDNGYHKCEHCGEWHNCNRSTASCLGAVLTLVLILFMLPVTLLPIDAWASASCHWWPNWAKGCESGREMIINDDLNRRVKRLEEAQPTPTPTKDGDYDN